MKKNFIPNKIFRHNSKTNAMVRKNWAGQKNIQKYLGRVEKKEVNALNIKVVNSECQIQVT